MWEWSGQASVDTPAIELEWVSIGQGGAGPPGPINATCLILSPIQGVPITPQTMVASGGAGGPYTFIASGLPTGLVMSSLGTLSGTPTVNGVFPYSVLIIDSAAGTGGVGCSVTVAPPAIVSTVCLVISGIVGTPLTPQVMVASGGSGGPYTFTAVGLPSGVVLDIDGTMHGTPLASGTFLYTVVARDVASVPSTPRSCTIVIAPSGITPPIPTSTLDGTIHMVPKLGGVLWH